MNMRERLRAVVEGTPHDRVPFAQYDNNAAPNEEIWAAFGRESMGILRWIYPWRIETPNCQWEFQDTTESGRRVLRQRLTTPAGELREERLVEPTYNSSTASRHFVKDVDDYRPLLAYLRDLRVSPDFDAYDAVVADLGDDGIPHTAVWRTPYQQLWIQWVSMQDLAVHMALRPDVMDEVFATLFEAQDQVFGACCELIVQRDVPYIVFPDNITAPMIRAEDFQSYCVASYERLRAMLEERGLSRPLYCHMDGDLEPLWPDIAASPIRGLDSMSPPPDNDTPVSTALGLAPGMRVGINFPSSVHLLPGERIYDMACGFLREGAPTGRFQIQISENAPPGVWRTSLPAIMRAIEDEGALG